jgi:thiosulfate reductase cytochrome b subunit
MSPSKADQPRERHPGTILVTRHSLTTRITHWINALCISVLLMSGLQILNAHPVLYWGSVGADGDTAVLTIGSVNDANGLHGFVRLGRFTLSTTGVLGASRIDGEPVSRAFPAWATLPSFQDLASGRRWHFFFAWLLVINGAIYLSYGFVSGHLRRDLLLRRREIAVRHLWHEVVAHVRLQFARGEEARHYNTLQKLAYLMAIVGLLPMMVMTGLTMSPGMDAVFPALVDLFGGRQSARTIHFATASLLVVFVVTHLVMVMLSGAWNNVRSMITGRYSLREDRPEA